MDRLSSRGVGALAAALALTPADRAGYIPIDLGTLGGTYGIGHGVNDFGQVVGRANTADSAAYHAFLVEGTLPPNGK